jgi:hypothetical protein
VTRAEGCSSDGLPPLPSDSDQTAATRTSGWPGSPPPPRTGLSPEECRGRLGDPRLGGQGPDEGGAPAAGPRPLLPHDTGLGRRPARAALLSEGPPPNRVRCRGPVAQVALTRSGVAVGASGPCAPVRGPVPADSESDQVPAARRAAAVARHWRPQPQRLALFYFQLTIVAWVDCKNRPNLSWAHHKRVSFSHASMQFKACSASFRAFSAPLSLCSRNSSGEGPGGTPRGYFFLFSSLPFNSRISKSRFRLSASDHAIFYFSRAACR